MLSPELLQKVQNIFIRSRHKVSDMFSGEYESAFRGRGIEFEEFREYVPGDDVRMIDWNVTARMDKPFLKVFREEREQTIMFLVDVSKSQHFGQRKSKLEVATEIAALLSYAAIKSNDKVGLIIFSDQVEKYIPPKKGRGHVWNIIASVMSHEVTGHKTNIKEAIQFFLRVTRRRVTAFVISDFLDDGYQDSLRVASMRHEFVAIRVVDPLEKGMAKGALMDFEDLESSKHVSVDMNGGGQSVQKQYALMTQNMQKFLGTSKIDYLELLSDEDYVEALMRFFIKREKRR